MSGSGATGVQSIPQICYCLSGGSPGTVRKQHFEQETMDRRIRICSVTQAILKALDASVFNFRLIVWDCKCTLEATGSE